MALETMSPGTELRTTSGEIITIRSYIVSGSQGEVYFVDFRGIERVLKWYKPHALGPDPQTFYDRIVRNSQIWEEAPEAIVMPLAVTEWRSNTFGYVMEKHPMEYRGWIDFMRARARMRDERTSAVAAFNFVKAMEQLHEKGLCVEDFNDGSICFHPETGDVRLVIGDSVIPEGTAVWSMGKARYMSPECIRGESSYSIANDRHSMAVVVFMLLCFAHPLEGKRSLVPVMTINLQKTVYGEDPIFIMDPDNTQNSPVPGVHDAVLTIWPRLPAFLKDFFCRAFGRQALHTPAARPTEAEWMDVLRRFARSITRCPHCCAEGKPVEVFCEEDGHGTCDVCGRPVALAYAQTEEPKA